MLKRITPALCPCGLKVSRLPGQPAVLGQVKADWQDNEFLLNNNGTKQNPNNR